MSERSIASTVPRINWSGLVAYAEAPSKRMAIFILEGRREAGGGRRLSVGDEAGRHCAQRHDAARSESARRSRGPPLWPPWGGRSCPPGSAEFRAADSL